jgi:vitamin B12 transporter
MSYLSLLLLIWMLPAWGEELAAIEVEASKDINRFTFSPSQIISTRELENESMGLVVSALEKVPGLVAAQNGGPGGRVSFFIRGTESRHVAFTLDGLKINDTSNTDRQFDAAFLTSAFIKEINIHKGPEATLYGSDALGGLIDIQTRKGENAPETRLTLQAGSFGTVGSSLSHDWKSVNHQGSLTATRFRTDGISRLNEKRFGASERDGADITQLTSSSQHKLTPNVQTELLASYVRGRTEQDGFSSDKSHDFSQNDQYILQQKTHLELSKSQSLSLRNGLNRHQRLNESLAMDREFFNGDLWQNELIHRLEKGPIGILTGISTEKESAQAINLDRSFYLHSAFIQSSFTIQKFKLHGGMRSDRHSKYGFFYTGSSGAAYNGFSVQYSQGYKAPSLYQLYGPDSFGAPVGNPNLVPETNHAWEGSWRKEGDIFSGGFTLFQNRLANQFTYSLTEGYLNQQRFIAEGIELQAKMKTSVWEVASGFTHQQFKNAKEPILRRPYNIGLLSLSYFPQESLELNITQRWFSSRRDLGSSGITKLNGYEVMDLGIRKTWEKDDVGIQLKNIFNREYEDLYGYSVLGRSLFTHYGRRF